MAPVWKRTLVLACIQSAALLSIARASPAPGAGVSPDAALRLLMAGNGRFAAGKPLRPHQTADRRKLLAAGQHPFAIVLDCSDSRVPPEIVFDQGLGDLFVVRVAGNIADDAALGSMEYAVEHLGVHLIMVLGHQRCGAVEAALKGGKAPGHIAALVRAIAPAIRMARGRPGDPLDNAVRANVVRVVSQLKSSGPILVSQVRSGRLKIVGGRYDLDTGVVQLLP